MIIRKFATLAGILLCVSLIFLTCNSVDDYDIGENYADAEFLGSATPDGWTFEQVLQLKYSCTFLCSGV